MRHKRDAIYSINQWGEIWETIRRQQKTTISHRQRKLKRERFSFVGEENVRRDILQNPGNKRKDISFHEINKIFLYNLDGNLNLKELYSNLEHQRKGMGKQFKQRNWVRKKCDLLFLHFPFISHVFGGLF